jgi:hypothetical protein
MTISPGEFLYRAQVDKMKQTEIEDGSAVTAIRVGVGDKSKVYTAIDGETHHFQIIKRIRKAGIYGCIKEGWLFK